MQENAREPLDLTALGDFIELGHRMVQVERRRNRNRTSVDFGWDWRLGWHRIGDGYYSTVYEHQEYPDFVLKLSGPAGFGYDNGPRDIAHNELDPWQVYARLCQQTGHEHLPQILHFEQLSPRLAWAVMPRYEPLDDFGYHLPAGAADHYRQRLRWMHYLESGRDCPSWLWPAYCMAQALRLRVDLHEDNVMYDPWRQSLVITDPFSYLRADSASSLDEVIHHALTRPQLEVRV